MKYRLNEPFLEGKEKEYALDVLNSRWLSLRGRHTVIFEEKFAERANVKHALAVQSGTAAIHTAIMSLGLKRQDKVIVPNYTCAGSIVGIIQCGACPVILDVEPQTFGLDVNIVEHCLKKIKPKALMIVHIYGFPARDTLALSNLCRKHGVILIEDCAEALGAKIGGRAVGTYGDIATYSIRSEKMIGVGEGGVVATNSKKLLERAFYWTSRAAPYRTDKDPYWKTYQYTGVGMNYLLPHLLGAVARAQIENFDEILKRKTAVGRRYREIFSAREEVRLQEIIPSSSPCFWLNMLILDRLATREVRQLGEELIRSGIEVRPGFWPLGNLEPFARMKYGPQDTAMNIFRKGIVLPSSVYLSRDNCRKVDEVAKIFLSKLKKCLEK